MNKVVAGVIDSGNRFAPPKLGGLQLWLAADRITGLNDGDPVTTWSDLSGNGNDVTQATAANKPTYKVNIINGKPVVRFDGVNDYLSGGDIIEPAQVTMFIVSSRNSGTNFQFMAGKAKGTATESSYALWYSNGARTRAEARLSAGDIIQTATKALTASQAYIHTLLYDAVNLEARTDGANLGQSAQTTAIQYTADPFLVGLSGDLSSWPFNGDIAEVIIYNRALSAADRARVDNYLSQKYNIALD